MGCNPCYDLWGRFPKPCPHRKKCMDSIEVEEVINNVIKVARW
jgi:heptosyltransferase-2